MTHDDIREYAKVIGITFIKQDFDEIIQRAKDDGVVDVRQAVWDFLDEFEGISHTADLDYFPNGDDDDE